jgi:hypothetical protein
MYRLNKVADDVVVYGVLNDFDLAKYQNRELKPSRMERTGTLPHMALDLLTEPHGLMKHPYRDDMESFVWVFLDLATSYSRGQQEINPPLQEWLSVHTYDTMYEKKLETPPTLRPRGIQVEEAALENGLTRVLGKLMDKLLKVNREITKWKRSNRPRGMKKLDLSQQKSSSTGSWEEPYTSDSTMDRLYSEFVDIVQDSINTWGEPDITSISVEQPLSDH